MQIFRSLGDLGRASAKNNVKARFVTYLEPVYEHFNTTECTLDE